MKRILITGGPTNEYIDEVMKITNMSTGSLSVSLGEYFLDAGYRVVLVLNNSVNIKAIESRENLKVVRIETTDDMLNKLQEESTLEDFDCIIHASAVGDYKSEFSFLMEDMAKEIYENLDGIKSEEDILKILTNPNCKINDDSKISSYQKNLTTKLTLTPKIIARLREWFPNTLLIGCKLLENVAKQELYDVAQKLSVKNNMDFIFANDLADLRKGQSARYVVDKDGFTGSVLDKPKDIFEFVDEKIKSDK